MVEKTKVLTENRAEVIKADIKEPMIFLKDESFDIVIASLVLHYVKDMAAVLKELYKKLNEKAYQRLTTQPHFLFVKAIKR